MISVPDPATSGTMSAPPTAILGLAEATDATIAGRKAAGLARLLGQGLPVPEGFVVTGAADLSSHDVIDSIGARLAGLEGAVAVRSSSTVGDIGDAIVGIPASPGRATGPARIVHGVAEFVG